VRTHKKIQRERERVRERDEYADMISISPPAAQSFFLADSSGSKKKQFLSIQNPLRSPTVTPLSSSFTTFNPLR
jgi:hypothetical protein